MKDRDAGAMMLTDILPWLNEHKETLHMRAFSVMGDRGAKDKLEALTHDIMRVKTMIRKWQGNEEYVVTDDGVAARIPGVFLDCPKASDMDAHVVAPTITMAFFTKHFGDFTRDMVTGRPVFGGALPQWCVSFDLASGVEDRGQLLSMTLHGESFVRMCWVRA